MFICQETECLNKCFSYVIMKLLPDQHSGNILITMLYVFMKTVRVQGFGCFLSPCCHIFYWQNVTRETVP